ncbi:hypothetical protein [Niallia circulans]|jgi:hypothetical protein|nr:hypothetical protein [Niallia circulans]
MSILTALQYGACLIILAIALSISIMLVGATIKELKRTWKR